jgi:hypothetical protein
VALRTADGGKTWSEETVPVGIGVVYLSQDGTFLTVTLALSSSTFTVLRYTGE